MKINYLKINSFGVLKNKEIKFNNNINIIYGKNESGKSTLLKFISGIFYGLSKNKNGKEISDMEKYTPWKNKDFSGKLIYELDNREKYEIFREFNKKNPKIFNNNSEDISDKFNIDKNTGNEFFYEQTNVDEQLFLNTGISMQEETKLDKTKQATLIQKITNLISSGDDSISFKKIIEKLNKKLLEEVGSNRTVDRPINIIENEINIIKKETEDIEELNRKITNISEEKNRINDEITNQEVKIDLVKKIKNKNENEKIENEKININKKLLEEIDLKTNELKNTQKLEVGSQKSDNKKNKLLNIILISIFILINTVLIFLYNNKYILFPVLAVDLAILIIYILNLIKVNKLKKNREEKNNKIKREIEILEENKINKNNEINNLINEFNLEKENENKKIIDKYLIKLNLEEIEELLNLSSEEINNKLFELENNLSNNKIKIHALELDKQNILPKIENQILKVERLEFLEEQRQELSLLGGAISLARSGIEEAYNKMKQDITPKFTQELSALINKITNTKYKNMKYSDEQGLIIELEDGNYINSNLLSVGTVDQMYLALRISAIREVAEENMPIILDETFAMCDDERLRNILLFLNNEYVDSQKLIFTCTKREIEILNELKIEYNLIEL